MTENANTGEKKTLTAHVQKGRNKRHVSIGHQVWYQFCRAQVWFIMKLLFRVRHRGRKNIPWRGPVLVVANHQSHLDPPAIGIGVFRRMNYLAKKGLFTFKPFAWLIASVDAIPLDQDGIGFQGIKETLRRLRNGEAVLIFPEGRRSLDGAMQPFRTGYVNIAVKSGAWIVPTAIAGSWNFMPPHQKCPSFFHRAVRVEYGEPIKPADYENLSEPELHALVERRVGALFEKLNA